MPTEEVAMFATIATTQHSIRTRPYSRRTIAILATTAIAAWTTSVAIGSMLTVDPVMHRLAVIAHILSLVGTFGAILLVDWVGFLWLIGRRRLNETSRLESAAMPLIWGGLAGLLLTGALMHPDTGSPLTLVKLAAVLVLMLNGILLIPLMRRLHLLPTTTRFQDVSPGQRAHLLLGLSISQTCWWTTIVVGFINSST